MSLRVLEWAHTLHATGTHDGSVPVDPFDVDGRCELIDGTPVHPTLLFMMTGLFKFELPTLRRYVLEADSRLVDYSVSARTHPEYMRTAVHVQARGRCETAGCDVPFHWLQVDHVEPHSKHGPTSVKNGQAQCRADNHAKTNLSGQIAHRDRLPPGRYRSRQRHRYKSE